ncbi:MAG: RHS repeat-associated core domain-containing protein, partial [Candidatus Hydrogenedentes bacterium]|nr:RHS repeat-associated core domain-containing protein [Candidatus Hydrogenedentota bacterium]
PRDYALHEWDPAIAAYRAPYRNYSPAMARWMTRDPLGMVDGPNMYGYVGGNPVGSVDPKGMALLDALLGLGTAAIIGLITTAILLYSTHKECKALAECTEALDNLRKLVNETTNTSGANGNISDDEISSESDRRKQLPNILNSPEYKDVLNKCQGLSLMNL